MNPSHGARANIILAGVGGQGVITAGMLIGSTAIRSGLTAVMSEIHGMSQRGGIVTVDLRIGDVYGPIIPEGAADLVVGFEAVETLRALNRAGRDAEVIMNSERIIPPSVTLGDANYPDISSIAARLKKEGMRLRWVDARDLANRAGSRQSTNLVLIGAAHASGRIPIGYEALEESVRSMFPPEMWEGDLTALRLGAEAYGKSENTPPDGKA